MTEYDYIKDVPRYQPPIQERLRVWYHNWRNRKVARAYKTLSKAMQNDPGFARAWHANIAMPIFDATRRECNCKSKFLPNIHVETCDSVTAMPITEANAIADRLMKHLFDVTMKPL